MTIQTSGDESEIDLASVQRQLVAALARVGLPEPEVSITTADCIMRPLATGKLRRIIPTPPHMSKI